MTKTNSPHISLYHCSTCGFHRSSCICSNSDVAPALRTGEPSAFDKLREKVPANYAVTIIFAIGIGVLMFGMYMATNQ